MATSGPGPGPWARRLALVVAGAVFATSGCAGSLPGEDADAVVTFAVTRASGGDMGAIIGHFNEANPDARVRVVYLAAAADAQRNALVQDLQARTGRYDVLYTDAVWTAEFAARGWLEPLDRERFAGPGILPAAAATGTYGGELYAAPFATGTGMLYYRSDLIDDPPTTWAELIAACPLAEEHGMDCYAGQFARYEGLTVNATEAIASAGGRIIDEDGGVAVDSPEARAGLGFLVDGFEQGYIPRAALTYMEDEARLAFQRGDLLFMRNWAFAWPAMEEPGPESRVQGRFDAVPLPGHEGPGTGTLGGNNLALSAYSGNKAEALRFIEFVQSEAVQRRWMAETNTPTSWQANYEDEELMAAAPHLVPQRRALDAVQPRPVSPRYNDVTNAVQKHVHAALSGEKTVDEAVADLQEELEWAVRDT
ncbi:multiple sugar transport system substrate-binding protein [Nocardiopsis mwathae]|uniref:Multiple sugar transport system substrate-binding protein n=1 Tax=Nocardiopsis mwathae TaxID=1472723 RepID=A0A7X0D725_9ACTN|nr:ABC transporter substrate-binding protein [Nocardiopsis mwathae]MBB6172624.1 multiple sugar transport system substrate-binding protein [Nocardiopsis mwathae]